MQKPKRQSVLYRINEVPMGTLYWLVGLLGLTLSSTLYAEIKPDASEFHPEKTLFIEAESFANGAMAGGWMVDPQFINSMGSSVLLAHGMGKSVADAVKTVEIPTEGAYRLFVRTRNWVATWTPNEAPGRFLVAIDGQPIETQFGTEGEAWHWQSGGIVELTAGKHEIALRDETGFDGRCDAILLTADPDFVPPNDLPGLASLRQAALNLPAIAPDVPEGPFDFVVVGGGMAGTCAAISAARLGLSVALVQNRFLLGGNNSSDIRVHLQGGINMPPYENLGNVVYELQHDWEGNAQPGADYEDEKKLSVVGREKNIHLYLATHIEGVEKEGDHITAVTGRNIVTNEPCRFVGALFADCTGDANLGFLAGAPWRYGRESQIETGEPDAPLEADSMTMGASVQWYSVETDSPTEFPELPWAIQFNEESIRPMLRGDWDWETGLNWNQIDDFEKIRDHGLRAAYGHWSYMKNHADQEWAPQVANRELGWVAAYAGKRESRRLVGDVVVDEVDICGGRVWPDATVATDWGIDLHYPDVENEKAFPNEAFRTYCKVRGFHPYAIPYRCFYSKTIDNLFMAGRDISVTHAALGTIRVMRTGGMMGEVVGMAASICKKYQTLPRGVYENYFEELKALMTEGVGPVPPGRDDLYKPDYLKVNLAPKATVTVSSEHESGLYPAKNLTDGVINPPELSTRFCTNKDEMNWVQFDFPEPVTLSAIRFITGEIGPSHVLYRLEYEKNGEWIPIPKASVKNRHKLDYTLPFEPVQAKSFRLVQQFFYGEADLLRLWEIELY